MRRHSYIRKNWIPSNKNLTRVQLKTTTGAPATAARKGELCINSFDGTVYMCSVAGAAGVAVWDLQPTVLKTLSVANDTVAAGIYAATTLHEVDADLVSANIKAGKTIFGIAGAANVVDTTEVDNAAAEGDIANGKIAFVNGAKITGTV